MSNLSRGYGMTKNGKRLKGMFLELLIRLLTNNLDNASANSYARITYKQSNIGCTGNALKKIF